MKVIQTRYAGCHFRSRLEARWAVFFDALNVPWEYEAQGFEFDDGTCYLPDFWLPTAEVWVEIKGHAPSKTDTDKFLKLAAEVCVQGHRCRLLVGDIPRPPMPSSFLPAYIATTEYIPLMGPNLIGPKVLENGSINYPIQDLAGIPFEYWQVIPAVWHPGFDATRVNEALSAARSARFEHGRSGAT